MSNTAPNSQAARLTKVSGTVTTLCAQDVAIARAAQRGTLRVSAEFNARLGVLYWAISDERGLIEVATSEAEASARVKGVAQ